MNEEREIIRRIQAELAVLEAEVEKRTCQSTNNEAQRVREEHRRRFHLNMLISATLKYGTMVTPNVMEITLPSVIGASGDYDVTITCYTERNENIVRVRRV